MPDKLKLTCPKCRKEIVVSTTEARYKTQDVLPAHCASCGRIFTERDLEKQATDFAEEQLAKTIKGLKF